MSKENRGQMGLVILEKASGCFGVIMSFSNYHYREEYLTT